MPDLIAGWVPLLILAVLALSFVARMVGRPGEAAALRQVAQNRGWRFVPGSSGGPAIRWEVGAGEGDARFREGKRRFLLGRHVRVRVPVSLASGARVRLVPPMRKHGRAMDVVYPSRTPSGYDEVDHRYDVHATSADLLRAVLADGTAERLVRFHPRIWIEVDGRRVEVRLAGEASEHLIETALSTALAVAARVQSAPSAPADG